MQGCEGVCGVTGWAGVCAGLGVYGRLGVRGCGTPIGVCGWTMGVGGCDIWCGCEGVMGCEGVAGWLPPQLPGPGLCSCSATMFSGMLSSGAGTLLRRRASCDMPCCGSAGDG